MEITEVVGSGNFLLSPLSCGRIKAGRRGAGRTLLLQFSIYHVLQKLRWIRVQGAVPEGAGAAHNLVRKGVYTFGVLVDGKNYRVSEAESAQFHQIVPSIQERFFRQHQRQEPAANM